MIDERVCEGCGDCGVKSNCLSLQPIDTEFGRKTTHRPGQLQPRRQLPGGRLPGVPDRCKLAQGRRPRRGARRRARRSRPARADPPRPRDGATLRMPGIGGTGVVTVSQMLAAAATHRGLAAHVRRPDRPEPEGRPGRVDHHHRRTRARPRRRPHRLRPAGLCDPGQPRRRSTRTQRGGGLDHRHPDRAGWSGGSPPPTLDPTPFVVELDARSRTGAEPLRRRLAGSPPACWATPSPPTCSCSAWPTRPASCP